MKKMVCRCGLTVAFLIATIFVAQAGEPNAKARAFFELRVYHFTTSEQGDVLHRYLQTALLPALHRNNISTVGVFTAKSNDTAASKRLYVLIPYKSLDDLTKLSQKLAKDAAYKTAGSTYLTALHNQQPYTRMEKILLRAFEMAPQLTRPGLTGPKADRVYELRSYEGPTEAYYENKVDMFNAGGEVTLFQRLGFNAVFYGEVLAGGRMPNLMYMTTFENKAARDAHWKSFSADAEWKQLSAMPKYQKNVSHIDIIFLTPTEYSDI